MEVVMQKMSKKIPWGVLAGIFGILCFYLTVAVFGLQFVFAQINGQTGQVATIFDTWWQTLLFVFDLLCTLLFACFMILFARRNAKAKKMETKRVQVKRVGGRK